MFDIGQLFTFRAWDRGRQIMISFALWIFPMAGGPCAILSSTCDNEDSARTAKLPEMGLIG